MSDPKYLDQHAKRAKEDALRDMTAEAERLQYSASFMVRHFETDEIEHGIIKQNASSVPEAVGLMYIELVKEYDTDCGWSPPSLILDDTFYAFEKSVPCGTCGDPAGPCIDPNMCLQNPDHSA
jgi:hypothetical protein